MNRSIKTAGIDALDVANGRSATAGRRIVDRCKMMRDWPYSESRERLFRPFLSVAHQNTLENVSQYMRDAGMDKVLIDAAANVVGRYEGLEPDAPALLIGSHLDSVNDAGCYDGTLGVMLGIECVAHFHALRRRLPFAIEVIGFGDEEGSRFPQTMLCSRAVAGVLTDDVKDVRDFQGISLSEALHAFGLAPELFHSVARSADSLIGYLEVHIEQGPVLEAEELPLGVVTSFSAQRRMEMTVHGASAHAGTTPMHLRRDALSAAAEIIQFVEKVGSAEPDQMATVGMLTVEPGSSNVVPSLAKLSLDIRAPDDRRAEAMAVAIEDGAQAIANRRNVKMSATETLCLRSVQCDAGLTRRLEAAVVATTGDSRRLTSGAGHDAMVMASITSIALLFVRCRGGISHNPAEHVEAIDAEAAVQTAIRFVDNLAETWNAHGV